MKEILLAYKDFSTGLKLEPSNKILVNYVKNMEQKYPGLPL